MQIVYFGVRCAVTKRILRYVDSSHAVNCKHKKRPQQGEHCAFCGKRVFVASNVRSATNTLFNPAYPRVSSAVRCETQVNAELTAYRRAEQWIYVGVRVKQGNLLFDDSYPCYLLSRIKKALTQIEAWNTNIRDSFGIYTFEKIWPEWGA